LELPLEMSIETICKENIRQEFHDNLTTKKVHQAQVKGKFHKQYKRMHKLSRMIKAHA
jgi:hypothetical protein